ncbi:hypothetical protein BYT27DRAFT_7258930 [Phlegmacium glaucopus]|nr:hypothetical protein BYT27DRAFT_7258930 [Phlegmacium glaucopus]
MKDDAEVDRGPLIFRVTRGKGVLLEQVERPTSPTTHHECLGEANQEASHYWSIQGPSRRAPGQLSRRHDQKSNRPEPWPRSIESDEFTRQPSPLSVDFNPLQTFQAQELSLQTAKLETPPSTTPPTVSQSHSGASGYEHRPILPPLHHASACQATRNRQVKCRLETSYDHQHHHYSASGSESSSDTIGAAQAKPKTIRFSSRSENPQPLIQTRPQEIHRNHLHLHLTNSNHGPEEHITSPIRPRELSIIRVKRDSEKKRRQGYFAQEEGAEKSPFRHYNKGNCDFES